MRREKRRDDKLTEIPQTPRTPEGPDTSETASGQQAPALRVIRATTAPQAAVLLLHGGRADGLEVPRAWDPAALRMRPFARAITRDAPAGLRLLLGGVTYRHRGWNGDRADPVRDAERALAELDRLHGDVPVVLVGHSMGGRAALRAAAHPRVSGVVALAPWCPTQEPVGHLRDRTVLILHGDNDRITDPETSVDLARRAGEAGARARIALVTGGEHAMLRRASTWHRLAGTAVAALLAPDPGRPLPPPFEGEQPARV